ncbi:MAG: branched-chain amino acid ABC transporter permease [Thermodesulfobacteriota bacterium]
MQNRDSERSFLGLGLMWWLLIGAGIGVILPYIIPIFYLHVVVEGLCMALLALSFNLLFGYMGQLSFGQAAFYGIGGYTVAMLVTKTNVPFFITLPAGIVLAGILGFIVGYFCVRLRGIYFAILTLAFGQLIFVIIYEWYSFTGGDDGIQNIFPPGFLKSPFWYYYFVLAVFVAATILMRKIVNSPFGYTLKAMRENTERTEFVGINIRRYQLIAFVIAAAFAGLAGALWAPFNRSVSPFMLTWIVSGEPVMATILGGPQVLLGPVVGTFIYILIHSFVLGFTYYWAFILGCIIIAVVLFLPGGILGYVQDKVQSKKTK